ncbi:MAG: TolC family protein [Acetobacteraceae bacterium]
MLAAALAGCSVGPDYVTPITSFLPFHNLAAVSARKTPASAPPLDHWWTGFNDPMLVTVVQRALDQNLDLAASLARVRQARAAAAGAGAQLLPTVDLDATATAEHQSVNGPFGTLARGFPGYNRDQREYTFGPAASWEIDLFGGLRRNANAARDEAQAAEADQAARASPSLRMRRTPICRSGAFRPGWPLRSSRSTPTGIF